MKDHPSCVKVLPLCRYISKGSASFGKSGGDKQYFFINGRPVNMPKARGDTPMYHFLYASSVYKCELEFMELSIESDVQFVKGLNDTHRSCAISGLSNHSRPMAFINLRMPRAT